MAVNPIQQILQMLLMGQTPAMQANPMGLSGSPGTDSEIGNAVGASIDMMTPMDEQPNYNRARTDPYVKFPEGGVEAPYREDAPNGMPSTEEELEGVHREMMGKGRDYAAEIMEALQSNDDATVDLLLSEMRDNGINIDTLPPDIQDQLIEMDMHPGYDDGLKE